MIPKDLPRLTLITLSMLAAALLVSGCRQPASPPPPPRPATAAPGAPVAYREVAQTTGLQYQWGPRNRSPLSNLDTFGAGCGFVDFNRDGWLDVLSVGEPGIRLFLGDGAGRFTDVSVRLGLDRFQGHWIGLAAADYDDDGWPDLLFTGYRRLLLLRNLRAETVADATRAAGLDAFNWKRWGASAGFGDLDGDGDLDLVVMNYVLFGPNARKFCELAPGVLSGCPPRDYDPDYTRVYENDRARFHDVTIRAECNTTHGKGLAIAFCDYDDDGRLDFYLGNDGTPSDLLHNLGGFRFRNVGVETGAAFGTMAQPTAAMGADWGDFDRDGKFDLAASAFSNEEYSLLRQDGGMFVPITSQVGMGLATFKPLGFGAHFLDADNDGRLDVHFTNGHVYDNVSLIDPSSTYAQPMMLFRQTADGKVVDVAPSSGPGFADPLVGRGSAVGDYDNDGRQDLLVVDMEGRLRLYHNETSNRFHWLILELIGAGQRNRQAYGARVEATVDHMKLLRDVAPASSYLSSSDPRVHFGLGEAPVIDTLKVRWPSGRVQVARQVAADRILTWREGEEPRAQSTGTAPTTANSTRD